MSQNVLTQVTDGIWTGEAPVRIVGMKLTSTMAVLELPAGGLLIYSPLELTPERRAAIDGISEVKHLYAPNLYHHMWIGDWATAYPQATLHAPQELTKKRPDLTIDRVHGSERPTDWAESILEFPIAGFRLTESVLLHQPSKTLVVADLVHNIGRPDHWWAKIYARLMGFHDRVALSRMIRWLGFSDRAAARRSLDVLLATCFDRIVVGHGQPVAGNANEALRSAFTWLKQSQAMIDSRRK